MFGLRKWSGPHATAKISSGPHATAKISSGLHATAKISSGLHATANIWKLKAALSLMVLVLFTGCAAPPAPGAPAQTDAESATTAETVEIRHPWFGSTQRHELYNTLMDMFEEEYPHIVVVREPSTWADYWSKLATQSASGNMPDLLSFTPAQIVEYVDRGAVLPLDSFVETGQIDLSDVDPSLIESGRIDGVLYMLPVGLSAPSLFTNTDLLERNGIEIPDHHMTWDEFVQFATQVSEVLGDEVWALEDSGGNENVFESFVRQQGEKLIADEGGALGFSRETLAKWYTIWDTLRQANAIPPAEVTAEEGGQGFEESMMVRGRVATHFSNGNQLKIYQRFIIDGDNLDLLRVPRNPEGPVEFGEIFTGVYLSIATDSAYPDAVATLINHWINDVEFNAVYNYEHGVVGSQAVNQALELDPSDVKVRDNLYEVLASAPPTEPRPVGSILIMPLIGQHNQAIAFGQMTIDEAVESVFTEAERVLR